MVGRSRSGQCSELRPVHAAPADRCDDDLWLQFRAMGRTCSRTTAASRVTSRNTARSSAPPGVARAASRRSSSRSIWASPDVHNCWRGRCGIRARDARMSLMLKSVVGLVDTGLFEDAAEPLKRFDRRHRSPRHRRVARRAHSAGRRRRPAPTSERPGAADQPRVVRVVCELSRPGVPRDGHHRRLAEVTLIFIVDDPKVFLRTSVINFDAFATLVGVNGLFYAGYGPADRDGVSAWLSACARPGIGLTWGRACRASGH